MSTDLIKHLSFTRFWERRRAGAPPIEVRIKSDVLRKKVEARPDFPKPALRLSRKTVRWEQADIEQWLRREKARAA